MRLSDALLAAVVFSCTALVGCGGGGGVSGNNPVSTLPQTPQTPQSSVIRVGSAAQTVSLPALPGIQTAMSFPAGDVPDGTLLNVATSLSAPAGAPALSSSQRTVQQRGSITVLFYATFRVPVDVTLQHIPAFSITLANTPSPNAQYYYAISDPTIANAQIGFRTEGPAGVSGSSISFAASQTSLTLHANTTYVFAFYGVDSGQDRVLASWPAQFTAGVPVAHALFTLKTQVDPAGSDFQNTINPCLIMPTCGNIVTQPFPPPFGNLLNGLRGMTATIDIGTPTFTKTAKLLADPSSIISSCIHVATLTTNSCEATTTMTLQQASTPALAGFTIDRIDTHYDTVVVSSPGSDPNHDGNWTDLSTSITVLVYGHPQ